MSTNDELLKDLERERKRLEQLFSAALNALYDIKAHPTVSRAIKEIVRDADTEFRTINHEFQTHDTE